MVEPWMLTRKPSFKGLVYIAKRVDLAGEISAVLLKKEN
jgi:hypothetical protein